MRSWYLYDGLGSVIAEVDEGNNQSGVPQVTAAHRTDVWGNAIGSETGSNHRFCGGLGHTTDSDTGLIYMRARYYDPAIGRFVSEDPSKNGENWYVYCNGNPTGQVDITGMEGISLSDALDQLENYWPYWHFGKSWHDLADAQTHFCFCGSAACLGVGLVAAGIIEIITSPATLGWGLLIGLVSILVGAYLIYATFCQGSATDDSLSQMLDDDDWSVEF